MLIMKLSIDSHKREKACCSDKHFGALKMRNDMGQKTLGQIAYVDRRKMALILTSIIQI